MEILGLVDTLESMILEGFKIPLTKKTVLDEEEILQVLDKIRLVAQGGDGVVKKAISKQVITTREPLIDQIQLGINDDAKKDIARVKASLTGSNEEEKATEVLEKAYKISKEVRMGADKYADEVLSTLEATSSRILRAVKAGRSRLGHGTTHDNQLESAEGR